MFLTYTGNLIIGLSTTVVGLTIVLLVLVIVASTVSLFRLFGRDGAAKPKKNVPEPVHEPVSDTQTGTASDAELAAVITAALAASLGRPGDGIVIRSIKRVPAWNSARTREQQAGLNH